MSRIKLEKMSCEKSKLTFDISVSKDIDEYFPGKRLTVEYSVDVQDVPPSILMVPMVANYLPLAWALKADIHVPCLDAAFCACIKDVVAAYKMFYPKFDMSSLVIAEDIVKNTWDDSRRCCAFFSGGLDAVQTALEHIDEKPDLLTVWGADIAFNNNEGWRRLWNMVNLQTGILKLNGLFVKSNFRVVEDELKLEKLIRPIIGDGWWHGIKHGLSLLGLAAPLAYLNRYSKLYIASSYCKEDGMISCASNPLSDNKVRFGGCQVVHDGFSFNRQDKAFRVVEKCKSLGMKIPMHVCWQTQTGSNCCQCEKCLRTITEILIAKGDPESFGFVDYKKYYKPRLVLDVLRESLWREQRRGKKTCGAVWQRSKTYLEGLQKSELKKSENWPIYRWLLSHDLTGAEHITLPVHIFVKKAARRMLATVKRIF